VLRYEFLVLSILFLAPGALVFARRPDLRPLMRWAALASLPFALTERWFYPEYWSPRFLFDLIDVLGFGIEDVIFVVALGAFTTTAYAFVFQRRLEPRGDRSTHRRLRNTALLVLAVLALALSLLWLGLPMLFATVAAELLGAAAMVLLRRDLLTPVLLGGLIVTLVYGLLCAIFAQLIPGVFERIWHTEALIGRAIVGVPLEELLYAFASGAIATAAFPFVRDEAYRAARFK
jgi:hypothetical protein